MREKRRPGDDERALSQRLVRQCPVPCWSLDGRRFFAIWLEENDSIVQSTVCTVWLSHIAVSNERWLT